VVTKTTIDQIPSLPQVLIQILDAIHSENANFQSIADIIRHDAAVATKLISVANSSYYGLSQQCSSIERALMFLGTDTVKTIVITASIKQFYGHFDQHHEHFLKRFWRRSLISANLAQVLATLTSYAVPDEAYLCGLLSDVGQLVLLSEHNKSYLTLLEQNKTDAQLISAETESFSTQHARLGGELVDSWEIPGFMADAVRYHHEEAAQVQDAHHLVKIVNLSNLLSGEGELDDDTLAAAHTLFGFNEALTRELRNRINNEIDSIANSFGIDIASDSPDEHTEQAHRQLGERLSELGELAQINTSLWQAQSNEGLKHAISQSLSLTFGVKNSILFLLDAQTNTLAAHLDQDDNTIEETKGAPADFSIPVEPNRSLVSDAMVLNSPQDSTNAQQKLSIIDQQLLRYCGADTLNCWPLSHENKHLGVLVFAANPEQLESLQDKKGLMTGLCKQIASAMAANNTRQQQLTPQQDSSKAFEDKIHEAVHEASNPLSIIRNYLEMLNLKLGDEHSATESLGLIKEEIDRIGDILLRLKDPELEAVEGDVNINQVVKDTTQIFQDSIFATKKLQVELQLDDTVSESAANTGHLKQILTNLLKNAAEALDEGGKISISSDSDVSFSGREYTAITIKDNGPGIPKEVKQHLFTPVTSTKGKGHSGLGLSIVKKLIDGMGGSIVCRSNEKSGTEIQLLLPKHKPA
jgi:HD-like signal output (HDOD) protein/signal transduction histidine kinase